MSTYFKITYNWITQSKLHTLLAIIISILILYLYLSIFGTGNSFQTMYIKLFNLLAK